MREIPILFSTPMVQAILKLIKKMTRRTQGLDKINESPDDWFFHGLYGDDPDRLIAIFEHKETSEVVKIKCPYGKPSDILWVRETWCKNGSVYLYKAGCPHLQDNMWVKWRPSIFMPREACRIKLKITSIRVERLQDITEDDAKAEGVTEPFWVCPDGCTCDNSETGLCIPLKWVESYVTAFTQLWDGLNEKRGFGWQVNPWVWVIEFERVAE